MGFESGRTRLPGFLRAWHFDKLFGIVNVFWPVVIEWLRLHDWRSEVCQKRSKFSEGKTKDRFCSGSPQVLWGSSSSCVTNSASVTQRHPLETTNHMGDGGRLRHSPGLISENMNAIHTQ